MTLKERVRGTDITQDYQVLDLLNEMAEEIDRLAAEVEILKSRRCGCMDVIG